MPIPIYFNIALISFLVISPLFFISKSKLVNFFSLLCVLLLIYNYLYLQLLQNISLYLIKAIFVTAVFINLVLYVLLKVMSRKKNNVFDFCIYVSFFVLAIIAVFSDLLIVDFTLQDASYLKLPSYTVDYGFIYFLLGPTIILIFSRIIYLFLQIIHSINVKGSVIFVFSLILLFGGLTVITNYILPLFGVETFGILSLGWFSSIAVVVFISIVYYQLLNIKLVLVKVLSSFFVLLLSILLGLFIYKLLVGYQILFVIFFLCMLSYPFLRQTVFSLIQLLLIDQKLTFQDFIKEIDEQLLDVKTLSHVMIILKNFNDYLKSDTYYLNFYTFRRDTVSFGDTLDADFLLFIKTKFKDSKEMCIIFDYYGQSVILLRFYLNQIEYGWAVFCYSNFREYWLEEHKPLFHQVCQSVSSSVQLVHSYDLINEKIKNFSNANEFVTRVFSPVEQLSFSILTQLRQTFGFDYLIFPQSMEYSIDWKLSNVDVPEEIKKKIFNSEIISLFNAPFKPLRLSIDGLASQDIKDICHYYDAKEIFIIPIVQDEIIVGFFIALSKQDRFFIDMDLLDLISKQISSILYRSIMFYKISNTRQFYQTIIDQIPSIIVVVDDQFNILFKNQTFDQFFGKGISKFDQVIQLYPSLDVIKKMIDFTETELTIQMNNYHYKLGFRRLVKNETVILLSDVTDLVQIQDTIYKSSKLKGIGTFVAGIAHEIKNPLVAVKTFTELLSKDWSNSDLRSKCYDIVLPQLKRIEKLSHSLKDLATSERSSFEPINVSDLINHICLLIDVDSNLKRPLEIITKLESNVMVLANSSSLEQVILNLSLNAISFLKEVSHPRLEFHVFSEDLTKLIIDVKDNGAGIPDEHKAFIFDPFFTTKDTGTGLGLSIVHQIILDHQGKILVLDNKDGGTVFRIVLPKLLRPKPALKGSND